MSNISKSANTVSSTKYPRVLIIGYDVVPATGTGVTLSCLFKGWPRDQIAVASGSKEIGKYGFAGHYYRLGSKEDKWIWPLSLMPREKWKVSGPISTQAMDKNNRLGVTEKQSSENETFSQLTNSTFPKSMLYNILDYLGANELAKRLHISKSFLQWFAAINPDIVYSLLGSSALVRFVYDLTNVINIPLALHFMDDWPSVLYRNGLLASVVRKRLITELNTLVSKATLTMAISDQMSIEFEGRYQRHFSTFHNALDLNLWRSHARTSWDLSNPIEVLYTGRIGIANQYSLIDVAYAISSLNQDGLNIRFTIVTQNINHPAVDILRKILCVSIIPPIPHEMIPSRLAAADILVLPLDFGGAEEIYAKYSMPTKSVEYMASGVPIVIYAPSDHAVSNYANSEGWAIVVGEKSPRSLKDAFLNLANNLDLRSKLAHRAILISRKNHNISLISEIFRENLATASIQRQPTSFPS